MELGTTCFSPQASASCAHRTHSARRYAIPIARGSGGGTGQTWAHSFLYSGLSALMLAIAAMYPGVILLPCLALVPFFYGLIRAGGSETDRNSCVRLGFLLGLVYLGVTVADSLLKTPTAALLKLAGGTALFALFGWAAGQARRRWGFNPVILAVIWVALEFALIKLHLINDILSTESLIGQSQHGPIAMFLYKTAATFGILILPFLIVLLNSVFALALDVLVRLATARGMALPESEENRDLFLAPGLIAQKLYLTAVVRGPPWLARTHA